MSHTAPLPRTDLTTHSTAPSTTSSSDPSPHTPTPETTMTTPTRRLTTHLMTAIALLTLVLTITLPLVELLTSPAPHATHPTTPTPTTSTAPHRTDPSPRISKADKGAARVDGCRSSIHSDDLLARPSCRSGMPVTRDPGASTTPPQILGDRGPAHLPTVPPAWADHWGAAAHSPYHHSQA